MAIFLITCVEGIIQLFTIFYLHRKFLIFLRNDRNWKVGKGLNIFWESIVNLRLLSSRNTTIIHHFLLVRKLLIFLRNDCDYNDVDLEKTRKRYVVRESSDLTRNMFWLASCFSKIKKPNSHFLGNQRGIPGVRN